MKHASKSKKQTYKKRTDRKQSKRQQDRKHADNGGKEEEQLGEDTHLVLNPACCLHWTQQCLFEGLQHWHPSLPPHALGLLQTSICSCYYTASDSLDGHRFDMSPIQPCNGVTAVFWGMTASCQVLSDRHGGHSWLCTMWMPCKRMLSVEAIAILLVLQDLCAPVPLGQCFRYEP